MINSILMKINFKDHHYTKRCHGNTSVVNISNKEYTQNLSQNYQIFCVSSEVLQLSVAEKQIHSGFALLLAEWGGFL